MNRLQSAHNAAARLVTGTRRSDHVHNACAPSAQHWLPVRQRVDFKVVTFDALTLVAVWHFAIVPSRLVADARERRRSTASQTRVVMRTMDIQNLRR